MKIITISGTPHKQIGASTALVDLVQKYPRVFKEDFRYWEEKGRIKKQEG